MYDVYFPAKVCVGRNSIRWFGYESKGATFEVLILGKGRLTWKFGENNHSWLFPCPFCVLSFSKYMSSAKNERYFVKTLHTYLCKYVHRKIYDTILNFHKILVSLENNSWKIFREINLLQLGFTKKYEMGHSVEKCEILFQWIFRQSNSLVTSLVKTLHSRNQCEKRENFCNFHTVWG